MSRIILSKHDDEDRTPKLVIGWDRPMATYFYQVMGCGDDEGVAIEWRGYELNELPTIQSLHDVLSIGDRELFTDAIQDLLRQFGEGRQEDDGSVILDTVNPPSWRVQVKATGESGWSNNGIYLKSKDDAQKYAGDLARRWTLCEDTRIIPCFDPPKYEWSETGLVAVA